MATQLAETSSASPSYRYKIGLLIKHPKRDLSDVSSLLGIDPDFVRVAGNPIRTPAGRLMSGLYPENIWSKYRLIVDHNDFIFSVDKLLDELSPHEILFHSLANSGGASKIIIQIPGDKNSGLELKSTSARKLAALQIDLELEIFPGFGKATI